MTTKHLNCWMSDRPHHSINLNQFTEGRYALTVYGEGLHNGDEASVSITGSTKQMWDLATALVDKLVEAEFTEDQLELMGGLSSKLGFAIQDSQVCAEGWS